MSNEIKIGPAGNVIAISAFGRKFSISQEDGLTREDRAADGTLRRDIIARKKVFTLAYDICDEEVVTRLETLYNLNSVLTITITHLTTTTSYTVLMGAFSRERLLAVWGGMWQGVTVEFREV
jgi:hypothetical protein